MSGVEIKLVRHKKAASRSPFLVLSCNNEMLVPLVILELVAYDFPEPPPVHPAFENKHWLEVVAIVGDKQRHFVAGII